MIEQAHEQDSSIEVSGVGMSGMAMVLGSLTLGLPSSSFLDLISLSNSARLLIKALASPEEAGTLPSTPPSPILHWTFDRLPFHVHRQNALLYSGHALEQRELLNQLTFVRDRSH